MVVESQAIKNNPVKPPRPVGDCQSIDDIDIYIPMREQFDGFFFVFFLLLFSIFFMGFEPARLERNKRFESAWQDYITSQKPTGAQALGHGA